MLSGSEETTLRPELRAILINLVPRVWTGMQRVAEVNGCSFRGLWRKVKKLEELGFIKARVSSKHHRSRMIILTKLGREYIKYQPSLATLPDGLALYIDSTHIKNNMGAAHVEVNTACSGGAKGQGVDLPPVPVGEVPAAGTGSTTDRGNHQPANKPGTKRKRARIEFGETDDLWSLIGLKAPVLSFDEGTRPKYGTTEVMKYRAGILLFDKSSSALKFVHCRRGITNTWYCPATVKLVQGDDGKRHKEFVSAQCLWLDMDLPRGDDGAPMDTRKREQCLSQVLQDICYDGLVVGAIVDSGYGYHIYFLLQNRVLDEDRLRKALRGLAERYGGDVRTAYPKANLRVPMSMNLKDGGSLKRECRVIWMNVIKDGRRNSLADIESVIGYRHYSKWWTDKYAANQKAIEASSSGNFFRPCWSMELLMDRVRNGWRPLGKSWSEGDLAIMAEGLKWGFTREKITGWFFDPSNKINISDRTSHLKGCRPRDRKYVESTYAMAEKSVSKTKSRAIA